ncbi:MAG: FecR domain-containing protein [Rhodopseudomonas sp.]|uniref:cadherin-like domain-containing protein n=1 Tax=Rhodopseudomonas sp. TaxID=1078 RepID=UPI001812CD28|nr:cadherin-like domain-containing protein [Rhodopseudomonas sp.]NVN87778.1 FecR domain-containing protein [Rhodopseudomonas sp.]
MNFAETFDSQFSLLGPGAHPGTTSGIDSVTHHGPSDAIIVGDAYLLFSGDYSRSGANLVISDRDHDHRVVVQDYFKGHSRAALASPDGARLSPQVVEALTGEVQVAQAGADASAAKVIGHVTKLAGSATAIRNGVAIQLNMGDTVNKGDVVQAGANSSLGLTFIDGTVFGLSSNARMVLNEMVYDPNGSSNSSLLSLVQGTITFVAGETAKHGDMKVDTPVATMGIRGTAVLVEIGFEVPGQGGAPPVKFQVLVEPGNHVGEYVLYSKSDPTVVIGTVNSAGQVTTVTGAENVSTSQAPTLTPLAQEIIGFTLQQYFPNYVPNANPQSNSPGTGSTPGNPVPGTSNPEPLKFQPLPDLPIGQPTTVPINLPDGTPGAPFVNVTITRLNTAPAVVVKTVTDATNFHIGDQVTITDPDSTDPVFLDVIVPYVPGSGRIVSAVGPSNSPAGVDLAALVTIDRATGAVSYDPTSFAFLRDGQHVQVTIAFDSRSGPDTVHESLTLTIDGVNDAPVLTSANVVVAEGGTVILGPANFHVTDPDSGSFTFTVSNVTHGSFQTSTDGVHWSDATIFTSADLNAGHVRFVHDGSEVAPTFSVQVDDGESTHHLGNLIDGTVDFTNVNDAPEITSASVAVKEGGTVVLASSDFSVTDPDSTSFTFTVSNVTHGKFQVSTDGVNWSDATTFTSADLDAGHVHFVHDGGEVAPTFSVQVDDGASVNHLGNLIDATVDFTKVNDAPKITSASLTVAEGGTVTLGAANFSVTDPDSTSFTFIVSNVTHGWFEVSTNGVNWNYTTSFTSADLDSGHVRFVHDGNEVAPSFSVQVDDGASVNHLGNLIDGTVAFTNVNDAPVITSASLTVAVGGTVVLTPDDINISDPDNTSFAFTILSVANGRFQVSTDGENWSDATTFTSADLNARHVRFVDDGSETAPTFSVQVDDGQGGTATQTVTVTLFANVWIGRDGGDWSNPDNWSLSHVPTGSEVAFFNTNARVHLSHDVDVAGLHLTGGKTLTLDGTHSLDVTDRLVNDGSIVLLSGTTLELSGAVENQGTIVVDEQFRFPSGATLLIDGYVTLEGHGIVTLDGVSDTITGRFSWFHLATLVNTDNTINGYGDLGGGHLNLINGIGGTIAATNPYHSLTIDTGFGSFTNDGLVISDANGGLEILSDVINTNHGRLEAHRGTLTVDGAVPGGGQALIDGGTLEFGGRSDADVVFSGTSGDTLLLDRSSHFTGSIGGFGNGDAIDLSSIAPWQIRILQNHGVLEVHYGVGRNDYFTITDPAMLNHLAVSSDHHGGTEIDWINHAPSIDTSNVHLSRLNGTTVISGLSVTDIDAASEESYRADATSLTGSISPAHQTGTLSTIDGDLENGFSYTPGIGSVGKVAVSVTDSFGATDSVNFIFSTSQAPVSTPLTLNGTSGRDVIFATNHQDTLTGAGGIDQFVFAAHSGRDTITDFTPGQDTIELDFNPDTHQDFRDWLSHAAHSAGSHGQDTLITFDGSDTLLLKNVSVSNLHVSDFIVHSGGSGQVS